MIAAGDLVAQDLRRFYPGPVVAVVLCEVLRVDPARGLALVLDLTISHSDGSCVPAAPRHQLWLRLDSLRPLAEGR